MTLASETRPVQWASGACGLRHHFPTIYGAYRIIAQSLLEQLVGNHQLQKPMYPTQAACQSSKEEQQQPAPALHRGTNQCCPSLWRPTHVVQMLRLKCAYASLLVSARGYEQRPGSRSTQRMHACRATMASDALCAGIMPQGSTWGRLACRAPREGPPGPLRSPWLCQVTSTPRGWDFLPWAAGSAKGLPGTCPSACWCGPEPEAAEDEASCRCLAVLGGWPTVSQWRRSAREATFLGLGCPAPAARVFRALGHGMLTGSCKVG